jgi:hypothetical protein
MLVAAVWVAVDLGEGAKAAVAWATEETEEAV